MNDNEPGPIGPTEDELARATSVYERALPPAKRFSFDISPLDTLGMAVMIESFTGEPIGTNDGFGYGASREEARVGALGELNEMVHIAATLKRDPGESASYDAMCARHGAERVVDPLTLCLPAGSPYAPDAPLRWVKLKRWPDGEAFVPREFVAFSGALFRSAAPSSPQPLTTPITNGLGAGLSLEQALTHGLLELFQRDGNCVTFRAMDSGTVVDLDGVRDPGVAKLIAFLQGHGIEPVAKLGSTEFGLTNLYVVDGGREEPTFALQATACGEAAHANAERALRKALLEFMAARCRKALMHGPLERIEAVAPEGYLDTTLAAASPANEEPRALREMTAWARLSADELRDLLGDSVLSVRRRVPLSELPSVADAQVRDPARRLADLAARLSEEGMAIYYYDATPSANGPHVVKAVVPGLECETMSYHRIGRRGVARLLEAGSPLVGIGDRPASARPVRLTAQDEAQLGGPAWLDIEKVDEIVGRLYPLYREPSSHTVQLALRENEAPA